jgi:hypothetical protein
MCLLERGDSVVGIDNQNAYYGPAIKEARLVRHASHPNYTHLRAEVVQELQNYGCEVLVHDPIADSAQARHESASCSPHGKACRRLTRSSLPYLIDSIRICLSTICSPSFSPLGYSLMSSLPIHHKP